MLVMDWILGAMSRGIAFVCGKIALEPQSRRMACFMAILALAETKMLVQSAPCIQLFIGIRYRHRSCLQTEAHNNMVDHARDRTTKGSDDYGDNQVFFTFSQLNDWPGNLLESRVDDFKPRRPHGNNFYHHPWTQAILSTGYKLIFVGTGFEYDGNDVVGGVVEVSYNQKRCKPDYIADHQHCAYCDRLRDVSALVITVAGMDGSRRTSPRQCFECCFNVDVW